MTSKGSNAIFYIRKDGSIYEDFTLISEKARVCFILEVKELFKFEKVEVWMEGESDNTTLCVEQERICGLRLQKKDIEFLSSSDTGPEF